MDLLDKNEYRFVWVTEFPLLEWSEDCLLYTSNVQLEKTMDKAEQEKLESVKKADAAVKTMQDFTSPEVLYEELIASVKKYHPSTDISMIQKAYEVAREAHKDQDVYKRQVR